MVQIHPPQPEPLPNQSFPGNFQNLQRGAATKLLPNRGSNWFLFGRIPDDVQLPQMLTLLNSSSPDDTLSVLILLAFWFKGVPGSSVIRECAIAGSAQDGAEQNLGPKPNELWMLVRAGSFHSNVWPLETGVHALITASVARRC